MERAAKIRKTDGSWAFCPILPASAGEGDEATEEALDMELREEIEEEWFHLGDTASTTRFSPYLDTVPDVLMEDDYEVDIDELPEYVVGLSDYYAEDLLLSTVEQSQDMDDCNRDMDLLRERDTAEWPEDMRRQYDEGWHTANRRHMILDLVRHFLRS